MYVGVSGFSERVVVSSMAACIGLVPGMSEQSRFMTGRFHRSVLVLGRDPSISSFGGLFVKLLRLLLVAPAMSLVVRDSIVATRMPPSQTPLLTWLPVVGSNLMLGPGSLMTVLF